MSVKGYQLKFKLGVVRNSKYTSEDVGAYYQTIEITLFLRDMTNGFVSYEETENKVNDYLSSFSGKQLNKTPPFDYLDPTLENIGTFFYDQLNIVLMSLNYLLFRLEIREKSTRIFSITNTDIYDKKNRKLSLLIARNQKLKEEARTMKGGQ